MVVLASALTGAERSVLPVLGRESFGVGTTTATLSFIVAFGLAKSIADFAAGGLAGRIGRRRVLLLGWVAALPVAPLIIFAPSWAWVVGANVLLGTASAFIWSSSVVMRLDLAGARHRGLAMGLSGLGPMSLGLTALAAGWLAERFGPRPEPFLIAAAASIVGILLALRADGTEAQAEAEDNGNGAEHAGGGPAVPDGTLEGLRWATWTNRRLLAANQAGVAVNATDGVVWGLFPLFLAQQGLSLDRVGLIAGVYPIVVGLVELGAGPLSDRVGRRLLVAGGMGLMGAALGAFALVEGLLPWFACTAALGMGYATAFPTLSAQVGDLVSPGTRPEALGVYRMWRDVGHAVGGLTAGLLADQLGMRWAMGAIAVLVIASGAGAAVGLPAARSGPDA